MIEQPKHHEAALPGQGVDRQGPQSANGFASHQAAKDYGFDYFERGAGLGISG